MKSYKKLLALGLSVAMLAGMTACGGGDDDGTPATNDTNTPATNDTNTPADNDTDAPADNNTDNNTPAASGETRKIRIGTWYDHYYDSTHESIWDDASVSDEEFAQAHFDVVAEVEQKYNVEIEFVNLTFNGVQESINTSILAGHPDCDIYEVDLSFGIAAALNGYAVNLRDVVPDADVCNDRMVFTPTNIGLTDDSVYLFTSVSAEAGLYNTYMLAYNKQILDDAGLEYPEDLYERGEWTWDKWREYMIALTQDTNGDGVIDQYGYCSRWDFTVYNLLMSNGTSIASTATENLSSPEVGEVLDFMYNMWNVDKVAKAWNADDFDSNQNAYLDGNIAFWATAAWISDSNQDINCDFDIVWCPWPIGPHGNADTNNLRNLSSGNAWMIPTGVEDPELVYHVFEDWANWYHGDTDYRDSNLTWWEDCAMTEENYAVMEFTGSRDQFDLWNNFGLEWGDDWVKILNGEMTAAQFQETWKQPVQDALDNFFK